MEAHILALGQTRKVPNPPALAGEKLSLYPRGHSFRSDHTGMNVFRFVERAHTEQFCDRLGGEFIDPKYRTKWPGCSAP
jgi:hypothetical protein